MTRVAVVTLAHGRGEHLARQHRSLARGTRPPDDYLLVAMGDPAHHAERLDGLPRRVLHLPAADALPLAAARNAAVADVVARGAEVVVALDVDCLAAPGLVREYAEVVRDHPDTLWSGPVTYLPPAGPGGYDLDRLAELDSPHPARPAPAPGEILTGADPDLFWSLSFVLAAPAWERIGGFCESYRGYGGEDTDFARQAAAAGVPLGWVGAARAFHQHHPVSSPPVEHLDDILRNALVFHQRWGTWPMAGWLRAFADLGLVRWDGVGAPARTAGAARHPEGC